MIPPGDCCLISKVLFDKPYRYELDDITIKNEFTSLIPVFDPENSGIWKPFFHNSSGIECLSIENPNMIKDWTHENGIVYNLDIEQTFGVDPNFSFEIIPFWYRYYNIDEAIQMDRNLPQGLELYIVSGEYYRERDKPAQITNNLLSDANRIYASLTGLKIYSTGVAYEHAKILSTGPQLDWITEVLSSGTGVINPSDRNEYGLDKEKLRQMSLKNKKSYRATNFILDKYDLVNALSNKYNGYFDIDQTVTLTSQFKVNQDIKIEWSTPLIDRDGGSGSELPSKYVNFKLDIGNLDLVLETYHMRQLEAKDLYIGYLRETEPSDPPFITERRIPEEQPLVTEYPLRYAPFYTGINNIESNRTKYNLFKLEIGNKPVAHWCTPISHPSITYIDTGFNGAEFHSLNGVKPIYSNLKNSTILNSNGLGGIFSTVDSAVFFRPQEGNDKSYATSNINLTIKLERGTTVSFSKNHQLSVHQLRNEDHPNCIPFINKELIGRYNYTPSFAEGPVTRLCECFPLSFNDPSLKSFDNYNFKYTPGIKIFPVKAYGGYTTNELINNQGLSIDQTNITTDHVPINGGIVGSLDALGGSLVGGTLPTDYFMSNSNTCSYSVAGTGNFDQTFDYPYRGIINLSYITESGNFLISTIDSDPDTKTPTLITKWAGPTPTGMINGAGNICINKKYIECASVPTSGNIVSVKVISNQPSTKWGFTLSITKENPSNQILYPMITVDGTSRCFFHPNSGLLSRPFASQSTLDRFANKSALMPHRYGNKAGSDIYDYYIKNRGYPPGIINQPGSSLDSDGKSVSIIDYIDKPKLLSDSIPPTGTSVIDKLNNYYPIQHSLIAYNTEKLYNNEYLDGINILIDTNNTNNNIFKFNQYSRDIIEKADYFGFVYTDNNITSRYITKDFHKFRYNKYESPVLEHIDFDFQKINHSTGTYPYNDLYIMETGSDYILLNNSYDLIDREWNFFDQKSFRNSAEKITIVPKNPDDAFDTTISSISGNKLIVANLPSNLDLIKAKIIKSIDQNKDISLLIYRQFLTANDAYFDFGKWGNMLLYSPYNHPTGVDKYNHSSTKTYILTSGEVYNPYLGWAGSSRVRNYNSSGQLLPSRYDVYINPLNRIISNDKKNEKFIESIGIGHFVDISGRPVLEGDSIIAFHSNINSDKSYFFTGTRTGEMKVAVTIRHLNSKAKLILKYGDQRFEKVLDGRNNIGYLSSIDPYYVKPPYGPFKTYNGGGGVNINSMYQEGDRNTIVFDINATTTPTFGLIEIINENYDCLSETNCIPIPESGYYSMDSSLTSKDQSLIDSICVFYAFGIAGKGLNWIKNSDRVNFYQHKNPDKNKDFSPFLDYHIYNNSDVQYINDSGIINFENVFTLKSDLITPYDSNKYWIDVQKTANFGILTKQNWLLTHNTKYLVITKFLLKDCNDRTKEYFRSSSLPDKDASLCEGGYNLTLKDFCDYLNISRNDLILNPVTYNGLITSMSSCCLDNNMIDIYPKILKTGIQDCCDNAVSGIYKNLSGTYATQSPTITDNMVVCDPIFSGNYRVEIEGYEFMLDQNSIFTKLQDKNRSQQYILGTGSLAQFTGKYNNPNYEWTYPEIHGQRISFDGNNFYMWPEYNSTVFPYGTNYQFLTSKLDTSSTLNESNCRHPDILKPWFKEWINSISNRTDIIFKENIATEENRDADIIGPDAPGAHGNWKINDDGSLTISPGGYYVFNIGASTYSSYVSLGQIFRYLSYIAKLSGNLTGIVLQLKDRNGHKATLPIGAIEGDYEDPEDMGDDQPNAGVTKAYISKDALFDENAIIDARLIESDPIPTAEAVIRIKKLMVDRKYLLSSQEMLENEYKFRTFMPHPDKRPTPFYDYSHMFDSSKTQITYKIDIRNKKCIDLSKSPKVALFDIKVENTPYKIEMGRKCKKILLYVNGKEYLWDTISNGSIQEISYDITEQIDFSCKSIPQAGSDNGPLPDMLAPENQTIPGIGLYECFNCQASGNFCHASVLYINGYKQFPNGSIGYPPGTWDAFIDQYNKSCADVNANTEWVATTKFLNQALVGNDPPDGLLSSQSVDSELVVKVKSNIQSFDPTNVEQVKINNYKEIYCSRIKNTCINNDILLPDIRQCCDNLDINIKLEIISYFNLIIFLIKKKDGTIISQSCINKTSTKLTFTCPKIKLDLKHDELFFTDRTFTNLTNCTIGKIQ